MTYKYGKEMKIFSFITCVTFVGAKNVNKQEQAVWRLECDLGVIKDPDCPIDGGWSPWGAWSVCQGPCDDVGRQRRTRECNNPPPSEDGFPCSGPEEESKSCYLTNCSIEDFQTLVKGDVFRLEAFHELETVPAIMKRCLQMECSIESIKTALANENTWKINLDAFWNSLQCVKLNMGCPVIGEWGAWGTWSACGARCGRGRRWRLRRCDTPPPSASHLLCSGYPLQAELCEGDQCAVDDPLSEAVSAWGEWESWSPCSENCGIGVRRRQRSCNETHVSDSIGTWGTHCRGSHDELELCEQTHCVSDGRWSGWGSWGPCSQSCGAGKRSRIRTCTRPTPAGGGSNCVGPRTEFGPCHLTPCEVYSHTVSVLNGESYLHYNFENKRSALFHFYVRFLPLSPHGVLVRRGSAHSPHVRLSLQKWHICLDASGMSQNCGLPRLCSATTIEPAVWHTALIAVTGKDAILRVDDGHIVIRSTFPCDPNLPDDSVNIIVGEKLHGEIQELALNFIPLKMLMERDKWPHSDFYPTSAWNVAYEKANEAEAFLLLDDHQYLSVPCFENPKQWQLELTFKPKGETGTVLFLESDKNWLHITLQNSRFKAKLARDIFRSESSSSFECHSDQWIDLVVSKKSDTNTIEVLINGAEYLHVALVEDELRYRHNFFSNITSERNYTPMAMPICNDEFYVGGIPQDIKDNLSEEFICLSAVVASLRINGILLDIHSFNRDRYKDDKVQISSRAASISATYYETFWGESNRLNLTCLHARTIRSPHSAHWLYLDTTINNILRKKNIRAVDDGRVLRLVASADNDLRGFYTCRAHTNKKTRSIITYGVVGKIRYTLTDLDTTTVIAVITTLFLAVSTLSWIFVESIFDLRQGHGFFRDILMSPEQEAEAVCRYIDAHIDSYCSKSDAEAAKVKARRRGRHLASRLSFAAQEPQGMMQEEEEDLDNQEVISTEQAELPALPEVDSSVEPSHNVFRCEACYISSPRHGSNITSPRAKISSSSSIERTSPRLLCSRLWLSRQRNSSRESLAKKSKHNHTLPRKARSKLLTLRSVTNVNTSPAQKILQKFRELKSHD